MSQAPIYTEYHPRWYRRRVSTYWWLRRPSYLTFILREVSSLFVAWFVVFTLLQIHALSKGADIYWETRGGDAVTRILGQSEAMESYLQFQEWARNPVVVIVNIVALFFVVFHSITWFKLAPQAMVVRLRGKRVPAVWIAGPNYAAWLLASALVAWIVFHE